MRDCRVLSLPEESSFLGCILHPGEPPTPPSQGAEWSHSSSGETPPSHFRGKACTRMCYWATSCTPWNLHSRAGLDPALRGHLLLPLPLGQILHPRTAHPSPQCPAGTSSPTPYLAGEDAAPQGPPPQTPCGVGAAPEGSLPQNLILLRMGPHPEDSDTLLLYPDATNTREQCSALRPPPGQGGGGRSCSHGNCTPGPHPAGSGPAPSIPECPPTRAHSGAR